MIRHAKHEDLEEINDLLKRSGLSSLSQDQLKDPCLVGHIDGKIRGIIWASVGASRHMAYIDHFAVDPAYRGLGGRLAMAGFRLMKEMGVKEVISMVENKPERQEALYLNERVGMRVTSSFLCCGSLGGNKNG